MRFRHDQIDDLRQRVSRIDPNHSDDNFNIAISLGKFYFFGFFYEIDSYSNIIQTIKRECFKETLTLSEGLRSLIESAELTPVAPYNEFIDYKKSFEYFVWASKHGSDKAKIYLSEMYAMGKGVPADSNAALEIVLQVAKKGDVNAQWDVAQLYRGEQAILSYLGESVGGGLANKKLSYMWFNIAASNGLDLAKNMRADLTKILSQQELSDAQKLSTECIRSSYKNCADQ